MEINKLSFVLFLFLIFSLLINIGYAEEINIAKDCLVKASEYMQGFGGGCFPEKAVDGNKSSCWRALYPCWIELDLGEVKDFNKIKIYLPWTYGRYYQYYIEVSSDGTEWKEVVDERKNTLSSSKKGKIHNTPQIRARFIRLTIIYNSDNMTGDVGEIEVYGEGKAMGNKLNLLKNTGFEEDTNQDGIPDRWSVEGRKELIKLDKRTFHKGEHSLKIVASDTPTGVYQFIPYDGKTMLYKLSFWVKTDLVDTTKAHIKVDYYSGNDKWLGCIYTPHLKIAHLRCFLSVCGKNEWKKYVAYFGRKTPPKKTEKIKISIAVNLWETPNAKGTAWFDDISVKAVEPDPKWKVGYPPIRWKDAKKISYSREVKDSGYLVSPTNPIKYILPNMTPEKGGDDLKITSFSFLSDYEPITFCVHALKKLEDVKLAVSDLILSGSKDTTIPSKNIDVRKVCYLYRKVYFYSHEYILSPTYLEEFDNVSIEKDRTQQFWLTVKVPKDAVPGKYKGNILVQPANAPAKKLSVEFEVFPINLLEPKGVYFGMYAYIPKKRGELKVHYQDMKEHGMTSVCHCWPFGAEVKRGKDRKLKIIWDYNKGLALVLDTYRDVGFSEPIVWYSPQPVTIAEKLGGKLGTEEFAKIYKEIHSLIAEEGKKRNWPEIYFFPADEGYPYPFTEERIRVTQVCNKILKEMGLKTAGHALNHPIPNAINFAKENYFLLDMPLLTFCHPPVCVTEEFPALNSSWKEFIKKAKKDGKKILFYNIDNTGINPEAMRFGYGVALWAKGAKGMFDWHYQYPEGNYYNEWLLSPRGECFLFYYPPDKTHKGGPAIAWEAVREGVEDYKLLYTLDKLIEQAEKSTDIKKKGIAQKAKKEVESILAKIDFSKLNPVSKHALPGKWEREEYGKDDIKVVKGNCKITNGFALEDYDKIRLLICKYIMSLQN